QPIPNDARQPHLDHDLPPPDAARAQPRHGPRAAAPTRAAALADAPGDDPRPRRQLRQPRGGQGHHALRVLLPHPQLDAPAPRLRALGATRGGVLEHMAPRTPARPMAKEAAYRWSCCVWLAGALVSPDVADPCSATPVAPIPDEFPRLPEALYGPPHPVHEAF